MSGRKGYVVARLNVKGKKFEILVDPDKAFRFREGEKIPIEEVVVSDSIYKDVRKGLKASPSELQDVFGTEDVYKIAVEIVKGGELQLTTEQRRELLERKKRQIIYLISRSAIDPKSKAPIPPIRIEKAMEEAGISVDLYRPVEEQVPEIVKALAKVIPIKIAKALIRITVAAEYAPKVAPQIMKLGEVKRSSWLADGSFTVELEIPAGMQGELIELVNNLTKGHAEVKVLSIA